MNKRLSSALILLLAVWISIFFGSAQAASQILESGSRLHLKADFTKGKPVQAMGTFTLQIPPAPVGGQSVGVIDIDTTIPPNMIVSWLPFVQAPVGVIWTNCINMTSSATCHLTFTFNPVDSTYTEDEPLNLNITLSYSRMLWTGPGYQGEQPKDCLTCEVFHTVNVTSYAEGSRKPDNVCEEPLGSVIGIADRTIREEIPMVGVDFALSYASRYSASYEKNDLDSGGVGGFNIGGWNPSVFHYYSAEKSTLFRGDGSEVSAIYGMDGRGYQIVAQTDAPEIYVFDNGRHVETRDPVTAVVTRRFQYDSSTGWLSSITDAAGNVTSITRDSGGLITAITSPYGQVTTLVSNSSGLYSKVTSPGGKVYSLTYKSDSSLLETFRKPAGQVSTFEYDSRGFLQRDAGNGGNSWQLLKLVNGAINKVSASGLATSYSTAVSSMGVTSTAVVNPSGMASLFSETGKGATRSESPIQTMSTSVVLASRRGSGYQRVASEALVIGSKTSTTQITESFSYADGGSGAIDGPFNYTQLLRTYTTSARKSSFVYDVPTRTKIFTTPEGGSIKSVTNSQNLPASLQIGDDAPLLFSYDSHGNISELRQGNINVLSFAYDGTGLQSSVTDGLGRTTSYQYDADERLIKTILPDLREIGYTYDSNGNITSITPPSRPAHSFLRNAMELVERYLPPGLPGISTPGTHYSYDLDKRLTKVQRSDGREVNYSYNSTTGLLESVSADMGLSRAYGYKPGSPIIETATATDGANSIKNVYTYYGSNIASIEQRRGVDDYRYGKVSFGFDADHRRISRTVEGQDANSASTISYTLNKDDKPTQIGAMSLSYSYPSGRLSGTVLDNISDTYSFDSLGNLKTYTASYTAASGSTHVLYSYELFRDASSRVIGKAETIQGVTTVYDYGFDTAGRLTSVRENGIETGAFQYDENSNRVGGTLNGSPLAATFDSQDRLITDSGKSYSYSAQGEMVAVAESNGGISYSYNALGQLVSFTKNGAAHSLIFDAEGALTQIIKQGALQRQFLYEDPVKIAAEVNSTGALTKSYVYANSVNSADYMVFGGERFRIIKDHLGSPRLIVKSSDGSVAQRIDYDIFGKILRDSNTCFQPFGFAGGIVQEGTQLLKFGARFYDPLTARWTSKDPILFRGKDSNLYGYVLNDPVNLKDPTGNFFWMPGAIGAAIGGIAGGLAEYSNQKSTTVSIARSTAIGAAAGFLSAYGGAGIGFATGFGANLATQVANGKSLKCVDYGSATISGLAGAAGTYIGGATASRVQLPYKVVGESLRSVLNAEARSTAIISNSVGGTIGAGVDVYGNKLYGE